MKKISAIAVLIICLLSTTSYAWVNLALTAAEIGAPFVMRNGVKWLIPASATANIPSRGYASGGSIYRNSIGGYSGKFMTAALSVSAVALMEYLSANKGKYPSLDAAMTESAEKIPAYSQTTGWNTQVGDIVKGKDGKYYKIKSLMSQGNDSCYPSSGFGTSIVYGRIEIVVGNGKASGCPAGSSNAAVQTWTYELAPDGPVKPATAPEFAENLSPDPLSDALSEPAVNDLDKLINAAPDLFSSPDEAVKQNAREAQAAPAPAPVPAPAPMPSPTPTNPNAPPAEQETQPDNPATPEDETEELVNFNAPAVPAYKEINLEPLKRIGEALSGKFPFSLVATVKQIASSFVSTPVAPTFSINFPAPFNYNWQFSLSQWDSWAATLRYILAATFLVLISMSIVKKWS
jgi:hypothetical protein